MGRQVVESRLLVASHLHLRPSGVLSWAYLVAKTKGWGVSVSHSVDPLLRLPSKRSNRQGYRCQAQVSTLFDLPSCRSN